MYVACFLILIVPTHLWPVLLGPYATQHTCMDVEERLADCGFETGGCSMMTIPQETAVPIRLEEIAVCRLLPEQPERHDHLPKP